MDDSFESFANQYPPEVQEMLRQARPLIQEALPGCVELVDAPSRIVGYGYGRRYADLIVALAPFRSHVNLMFSRGAELPDPERLLAGTGKKARHVRLASLADAARPAVRTLLEAALKLFRQARKLE